MRIVATVERYAPAIGGAERVVQRIAEGLAARGHEMHVLTGGGPEQVELAGVQVHRVPVSGNEVRGVHGPAGAVVQTIERIAPDVVFNYAAQTWATDCCFELLDRPVRPRMVLAPCGFSGLRARRYRAYFEAMPARLRAYDALILHSAVYQDWAFAERAGAERRFVIANGADKPGGGAALRATLPSGKVAVTVGSHVVSKGHAGFARAVRRLARERQLTGLVVAPPRHGTDALRGCQLTCRVRERLGQVRLIDGSRPGAVGEAVAAADLFLFASTVECAPLVILEAMAAGTPWISYDVGNVSELTGGVVVSDAAEQIAAARRILDGDLSGLGEEGRAAWQRDHRWEEIVPRYESVFASVLEGAPAPAR